MGMSAAIGWPPAKRHDRQLTSKVWRTGFPGSLENSPVVPDQRGSARLGGGRALIVSRSSMRESCRAADLAERRQDNAWRVTPVAVKS